PLKTCEGRLKHGSILNGNIGLRRVSSQWKSTAYGKILGIAEANLVWTYLNKGTHEEADRDDFDAEVVEVVVRTLEELDVIDLRPRR
ncbi:hypothetical protein, partial [Neorhizobium alkalisoli]|uniref:hypothetical protein n=1 Tax=Neorhizobium alkalisoli TaxID=528178 RepID=UPI0011AB0696